MYIIGGATFDDISSILNANQSPDGSISEWAYIGDLPDTRYWISAINKDKDVYVLGGARFNSGISSFMDTVFHSKIQSNGSFTSWSATTPFPIISQMVGRLL